jgi:hypothetical protein
MVIAASRLKGAAKVAKAITAPTNKNLYLFKKYLLGPCD